MSLVPVLLAPDKNSRGWKPERGWYAWDQKTMRPSYDVGGPWSSKQAALRVIGARRSDMEENPSGAWTKQTAGPDFTRWTQTRGAFMLLVEHYSTDGGDTMPFRWSTRDFRGDAIEYGETSSLKAAQAAAIKAWRVRMTKGPKVNPGGLPGATSRWEKLRPHPGVPEVWHLKSERHALYASVMRFGKKWLYTIRTVGGQELWHGGGSKLPEVKGTAQDALRTWEERMDARGSVQPATLGRVEEGEALEQERVSRLRENPERIVWSEWVYKTTKGLHYRTARSGGKKADIFIKKSPGGHLWSVHDRASKEAVYMGNTVELERAKSKAMAAASTLLHDLQPARTTKTNPMDAHDLVVRRIAGILKQGGTKITPALLAQIKASLKGNPIKKNMRIPPKPNVKHPSIWSWPVQDILGQSTNEAEASLVEQLYPQAKGAGEKLLAADELADRIKIDPKLKKEFYELTLFFIARAKPSESPSEEGLSKDKAYARLLLWLRMWVWERNPIKKSKIIAATRTQGVDTHHEVEARDTKAGLAVTRRIPTPEEERTGKMAPASWGVTHIQSGFLAIPPRNTLKKAQEALKLLTHELDWDVPHKQIGKAHALRARDVRDYLGNVRFGGASRLSRPKKSPKQPATPLPKGELSINDAIKAALKEVTNPAAQQYLKAAMEAASEDGTEGLRVQLLYILGNIQNWRGENASRAKAVFKKYIKEHKKIRSNPLPKWLQSKLPKHKINPERGDQGRYISKGKAKVQATSKVAESFVGGLLGNPHDWKHDKGYGWSKSFDKHKHSVDLFIRALGNDRFVWNTTVVPLGKTALPVSGSGYSKSVAEAKTSSEDAVDILIRSWKTGAKGEKRASGVTPKAKTIWKWAANYLNSPAVIRGFQTAVKPSGVSVFQRKGRDSRSVMLGIQAASKERLKTALDHLQASGYVFDIKQAMKNAWETLEEDCCTEPLKLTTEVQRAPREHGSTPVTW